MAVSCRHERSGVVAALGWALVTSSLGCSVGEGQGQIGGHVVAADFCMLDQSDYELVPSFFGAQVTEDHLDMRVQRGSAFEQFSDGLSIHVRDVNEVRRQRIGLPIPIDGDWLSIVQMVFYLNETCEAGFPNEHRRRPVVLEGVGGTVTFRAIYAPDIDPGATGIEARLDEVFFVDAEDPEGRHATLSGSFSFFYQRGAPAQRFP